MFRRHSHDPGAASAADRLAVVRRLSIETLARRGIAVTPGPSDRPGDDQFVGRDGHQYLLHNLQLHCARLQPPEWAPAVEGHFGRYLAGRTAPRPAELSDAEFLAQIRTRLTPPTAGNVLSMTYARPAFDGLVAELSRDLPTTVHTVGDGDLAGRDLDLLYQVGQRNTDAEPMSVQRLDHGVVAVTGESFYIASKALNLAHLARTVFGVAPLGVVFGVPHRSLLFLHAVGTTTIDAVSWIAAVTVGQAENPPGGAVSPDSYYEYGGTVQRITAIDPAAKSIGLQVEGAFAEAVAAVAAEFGSS